MKTFIFMLTAICLMAVTLSAPVYAKEDITSAAYLSKLAHDIEKEMGLPAMVDKGVKLVSVKGYDHELQYNYLMTEYSSKDIDGDDFTNSIRPDLVNMVCTEKDIQPIVKANVKLSFTYSGNDNKLIGAVSVTKDMCR